MLLFALLAIAEEPADDIEEIVVIAEKNAWDGSRWHVRSEQRIPNVVTLRGPMGDATITAWTVDWVLDCEVRGFRHAACAVQDVSLTVEAPDDQAESLAAIVDHSTTRLAGLTVHVNFDGQGELNVTDVIGLRSDDGLGPVVDLAMRVFAGVDRPAGPFEDGIIWWRGADRILRLPSFDGVISQSDINHFGNVHRGRYVVQSVGRLSTGLIDMPDGADIPESMRVERVRALRAHVGAYMGSVSWYDLESGFLEEREVRVDGYPAPQLHRATVRRLDRYEPVDVGNSSVVAAD